jgi:hypothetical protein
MKAIDFHSHIYPSLTSNNTYLKASTLARKLVSPLKRRMVDTYKNQTYVSDRIKTIMEDMSILSGPAGLLIESSYEHFCQQREKSFITKSLVVPQPPIASNDFVKNLCLKDSSLIPVHYFVEEEFDQGAKIFKLHPFFDKREAYDSFYIARLKKLNEEQAGSIIILHTGEIGSGVFNTSYKSAVVKAFYPYFDSFPELNFVLAHMNLKNPNDAAIACREFENVYSTSSWQSANTLMEFIKLAGHKKLLFASDWPTIGDNFSMAQSELESLLNSGRISYSETSDIAFHNADRLLSA